MRFVRHSYLPLCGARQIPFGERVRVRSLTDRLWRTIASIALLLLITACGSEDTLIPILSIEIVDESPVDSTRTDDGVLWLSSPGQAISFDPSTESARRLTIPGGGDPAVIGRAGDSLLLLVDRRVVATSPDSVGLFTLSEGVDAAVIDTEGGFLLESIAHGEIVARQVDDLLPVWGWGGVGAASSALALSPEGDRLYQASVGSAIRGYVLRVRDLLSGRTLQEVVLDWPIRVLRRTGQGDLIGAGWDEDGDAAFLTRLAWRAGELTVEWHRLMEPEGVGGPARLAISRDGRRIALAGNDETGLTLFDGETGSTIAIYSGAVRDAVFDDFGNLYLLTPAAVIQVE